jgi:hypothetical protein
MKLEFKLDVGDELDDLVAKIRTFFRRVSATFSILSFMIKQYPYSFKALQDRANDIMEHPLFEADARLYLKLRQLHTYERDNASLVTKDPNRYGNKDGTPLPFTRNLVDELALEESASDTEQNADWLECLQARSRVRK